MFLDTSNLNYGGTSLPGIVGERLNFFGQEDPVLLSVSTAQEVVPT